MARVFTGYTPVQLNQITDVLYKAMPRRQFRPEDVEQKLLDVLYTSGLARENDCEGASTWEELTLDEPSLTKKRDYVRRLARRKDPVRAELSTAS